MINSALDRLLSLFTHFAFIFIDIYFHLRITIRESIHFNVIENPESCGAAVYNFVALVNNNHKGDNNVR